MLRGAPFASPECLACRENHEATQRTFDKTKSGNREL